MKPEEIEALGYGNEVIWQNLEQEIMNDVARRIKETGVVTRSADFQLNQIQKIYGYSDEMIKELLKETMGASDAYIDRVYDEAIRTDYIDNKDLYKAKGKAFVPFEKNESMQSFVRTLKMQSKEEMENFSRSLGFVIGKTPVNLTAYYQSVLDNAILQIASGGFDSKTALKKAVSNMTNSGIRRIDYESGHHNRVTVAARRSITTGLSQMTQKISEYNAAQLGTEYFEVAWHANARPTHREWHGQVWSKQELESVCGLGTVEGLCGANCYHVYYPFIKGLSKRNWSDEWLQEQNAKEDTPITFNGREYTGYEATQRQRVLETRMRAQREAIQALQAGDGDELDIMFMQAKYRASMDEYVRFSKAMGLREQRDRIYVDGLGKRGSDMKKGLYTKKEYGALMKYISSDSYKINEKLRKGNDCNLDEEEKEFVRLLDAALSKTKNYKGVVNRSISFMYKEDVEKFISMHTVDKPIFYNQYISSTTKLVYNEDAEIQIHIKSLHGKDLRGINKDEQEVLFSRKAAFNVKHISCNDGKYAIWLEEI